MINSPSTEWLYGGTRQQQRPDRKPHQDPRGAGGTRTLPGPRGFHSTGKQLPHRIVGRQAAAQASPEPPRDGDKESPGLPPGLGPSPGCCPGRPGSHITPAPEIGNPCDQHWCLENPILVPCSKGQRSGKSTQLGNSP